MVHTAEEIKGSTNRTYLSLRTPVLSPSIGLEKSQKTT